MFSSPSGFQNIPPAAETAKKLYKNFFGGEARKIQKRQILGNFFDVIIVVDSSSSVSSGEFVKGLRALRDLVGKSRNDTVYAAVTYATRAKIEFNFASRFIADEKIGAIRRTGGKTNTQAALKLCKRMYVEAQYGARQGSFHRILIVTDGQSNIKRNETIPSAFELKLMGIEIFVIAVGEYLEGIKELVQVASSSDAHMYRVLNMSGLVQMIKLIPDQTGRKTWIEENFGQSEGDDEESSPLGRL